MRRSHYAILASLLVAIVFVGLNLASWKWLAPARENTVSVAKSPPAARIALRLCVAISAALYAASGLGSLSSSR